MKSTGKNSKESQSLRTLQNQLDLKSKICAEQSLSVLSLQNHNAALIHQSDRLAKQLRQLRSTSDATIANLQFHISILEDRNKEILMEKRDAEIKYDTLKINYDSLGVEFDVYRGAKEEEMEEMRKKAQEEKMEYFGQQNAANLALAEHSKLIKQINELKQLREQETAGFRTKIADIERDKIQSIDSIKKQMLSKACEMRNKALEIRKQQFQTTTRLTFLQNDQLIRELQFQSSKTEAILKRNTELEKQVKDLKRCIEIHESVEKEIMKRNVIAKNALTTLSSSIKGQNQATGKPSTSANAPGNEGKQQEDPAELVEKITLLQEYNKGLEATQKQQAKQIESLKNQCESVNKQLDKLKSKTGLHNCNNIAALMIRYYEQILNIRQPSKPSLASEDDIEALKQIQINKWPKENVQQVVEMVLNSIKPYLSQKVLKMPYFHPLSKTRSESLDYQALKQNSSGSKYVEALKRQRNRSLERGKEKSLSHILQDSVKKPEDSYRKLISQKSQKIVQHESLSRRFLKPHLLNKI